MENNQKPRLLPDFVYASRKKRCCKTCLWAWHKENWNPKFKNLDGEFMCHNPKGIKKGESAYHTVVKGDSRGCREHEPRRSYGGKKENDI